MYCFTDDGLLGMIRQLQPRFHIENNFLVIDKLAPHLHHVLTLKSIQTKINETLAQEPSKRHLLSHNLDFYTNIEEICSQISQLVQKK
mmetsp:Transcript_26967/g.23851  ORF Transcript_26967/g.23851 Transcript_26967/m.23851 type:complete len:88 (+) Transcript_26967:392-655(+)